MRIVSISLALLLLLLPSCAKNPATGKRQLSLVPKGQEIELGRQSAEEVRRSIGLVNDPKLQAYVADVGKRLAAVSERKDLPWSFEVIDDAAVNAFALPGGPVFVTRGLMGHLTSEAELAAVMGQEIGHVTLKHSVSQISRAELAQAGLIIGTILKPELANYGKLAGAGLNLLMLKYGRDAEDEADAHGVEYMHNAGYPVKAMPEVLAMLGRVGGQQGQGRLPVWLSTHPEPEKRVAKTQGLIAQLKVDPSEGQEKQEPLLAAIDGLPYGENPRNGFFEGNTFYHPDLAFQLDLPAGWKKANLPQAVVAVSPREDAIVQLGPASKSDPETTLRQFIQQSGVQVAGASVGSVNELPAAATYFAGNTEQGPLEGLVTFVALGGTTYAMLGYTPAGNLQAHDAEFRAVAKSFRALTDPAKLSVKAPVVQLVKLDAPMTLAQFNQKYPSTIAVPELAIINGVQEADTIPAGATVKRVVAQ